MPEVDPPLNRRYRYFVLTLPQVVTSTAGAGSDELMHGRPHTTVPDQTSRRCRSREEHCHRQRPHSQELD